jgi:gas vesicle protein
MADFERIDETQSGRGMGLVLTFLLIGLGAGAVAGLLFAPTEGKKTRRMLKRKYEDAMDAFEDFRQTAEEVLERGGEWANTAKEKVAPIRRAIRR